MRKSRNPGLLGDVGTNGRCQEVEKLSSNVDDIEFVVYKVGWKADNGTEKVRQNGWGEKH